MSALRTVTAYEAAMWRGLYRWVGRRPHKLAPGDVTFGHAGPVKPIFVVFIVLSALEIPILDLIISRLVPWPAVRYIALAAGVYGLIWMLGLVGALLTNPHVVGDAGIRVRNGTSVDVTIPWEAIAGVGHRYRALPSSRAIQVEDGVLNLGTGNQTSVDITLREPRALLKAGPVKEVRFYADDPKALVSLARTRL